MTGGDSPYHAIDNTSDHPPCVAISSSLRCNEYRTPCNSGVLGSVCSAVVALRSLESRGRSRRRSSGCSSLVRVAGGLGCLGTVGHSDRNTPSDGGGEEERVGVGRSALNLYIPSRCFKAVDKG